MANFFANNKQNTQASPQEILQTKYNNARMNLILAIAFTAINIVLLFGESSSYFLFSLFVPYLMVLSGMLFTGRLTEGLPVEELVDVAFLPDSVLTVTVAVAAVIVVLYLLCWIFSKNNRVGWLIFALVLFSIDTAILLFIGGISLDSIIDIAFHVWVIVSLAIGINAHSKLKNLPPEDMIIDSAAEIIADIPAEAIEEAPVEATEESK